VAGPRRCSYQKRFVAWLRRVRMPKYGSKAKREVRTEMRHYKRGKHGIQSRKQAIAIGLSKARRKGGRVPRRRRSK